MTLFLYRRVVLVHLRSTSAVSVSLALTISFLMFSWMGASTVHMKRVPMLMPLAPRHSAAASPCPSAKPPEAMKGTLSDCRARLSRMKFVMSDSPTWLRLSVSEAAPHGVVFHSDVRTHGHEKKKEKPKEKSKCPGGWCVHEAGRMPATVRDMCKADKGWRPDPGLGDVVQQDEAVSRAAHDVHRPVRKNEGGEKGPWHGKCHVASLNHGDRSMTGPACGAIINSPCALEAIDAEEVDTELDGALCMSNSGCARCHHVSVCRTHKERGKDGESSLDGAEGQTYCTCAGRYIRPLSAS